MAKDARALRDEAAEATASGKYKRALAAYLELERLEPRDAQWAKRAGETYKRLGNNKHAIEAFERSADRYAQNGFLVQAIAVCKLVLQIDPNHAEALRRLAQMNQQLGVGPTRAGTMADNNPSLHENPHVAALRRPGSTINPRTKTGRIPPIGAGTGSTPIPQPDPEPPIIARTRTPSPPAIATSRTKSRPIQLPPGAAINEVKLSTEVPEARPRDSSTPGVHVIPIDDDDVEMAHELDTMDYDRASAPVIEIQPPDEEHEAQVEELDELDLADIEEIPLPEPLYMGEAAHKALQATPLFAGLSSETLEALVSHLTIVHLEATEVLFQEGEPGDALYVIVEGEVAVLAEGPPRVEMARLGAGSFIGEVALMTDQPRSATVAATTPSELLRIDRVTLSRVLADHGDVLRAVLRFVRDRLVDRWMRTSPLFRPFGEAERFELAAKFNFLEIEDGTRLIDAGSKPDGLYIVLAGHFVVQRDNSTLATLGAGELIGEHALLSGGVFKSNVTARGKSLALHLPAGEFREIIMTHPHVLEYISEQTEHSRRLHLL
jgi:CRP-like cAMP-binding protein